MCASNWIMRLYMGPPFRFDPRCKRVKQVVDYRFRPAPLTWAGWGMCDFPKATRHPTLWFIPAKEQLSFSTSQITYAPSGFKP